MVPEEIADHWRGGISAGIPQLARHSRTPEANLIPEYLAKQNDICETGYALDSGSAIDRGHDCRQPTSEMCAGSLLPSIGDVGRLAPEKTVTAGPIGFRDASRTTAKRGIRTLLRDSARWRPQDPGAT
ncbi:MAG: hypothetical protein ABSG41_04050 [Bryobacteraceae bacterium]|jgi:hypothetical protein